jgi:hypothetical protein
MGGIVDGRGHETGAEDACTDGKACITVVVVMVGRWTRSMVHWTRSMVHRTRAAAARTARTWTGARAERKGNRKCHCQHEESLDVVVHSLSPYSFGQLSMSCPTDEVGQ